MSALVLGATGLCGSAILAAADASEQYTQVIALVRRNLVSKFSSKVVTKVVQDSTTWKNAIPAVDTVFSGLATTRSAAGSLEEQYKIDHDLNVELARAAKEAGVKTYVLVSAASANADSFLPYLRQKGETENDIAALGFEKTILLRPGMLLGERDPLTKFAGFGANFGEWFGKLVYRSPFQLLAGYPIFGREVGEAAVMLAESLPKGVHIISSQQMLELVRSK